MFKVSKQVLALVLGAIAFIGLAIVEPEKPIDDESYSIMANDELPTAENARAIYDGRTQRAEAEVVRNDCPNGRCTYTLSRTYVNRPVNGDLFSGVFEANAQAHAQALSGTTIFRSRTHYRSGPLFPNRPRLFRR